MSFQSSSFVFCVLLFASIVGCAPIRGTMPARTWRPEDPAATCTLDSLRDRSGPAWSAAGRTSLDHKLKRGEPAVVSALGCRVEVLGRCSAPGSYGAGNGRYELDAASARAQDLDGECEGATHVVRSAGADEGTRVELLPLSLDSSHLTGSWSGVMRQPGGPYEVYEIDLDLEQEGSRVTGITHVTTTDHQYWGIFRIEGRVEGNTLYFADAEIVDDNLGVLLEWCGKGGYLLADPRNGTLRGPWSAGSCAPGSLELELEQRDEPEHAQPGAARKVAQ